MADSGIKRIDWKKIVGKKTIKDGGYVGDMMTVARIHINDAKRIGNITQSEAGAIYTNMISAAFQYAVQYAMGEAAAEENAKGAEFEALSKEAKSINDRILSGMHVDGDGVWTGPIEDDTAGKSEMTKLKTQQEMMDKQNIMLGYDESKRLENIQADLDQKAATMLQLEADIDFNIAKKRIMEYTRNDNIRVKATEQFSDFIKYISSANVIAGERDFKNMRALVRSVMEGLDDPYYSVDDSEFKDPEGTEKNFTKVN